MGTEEPNFRNETLEQFWAGASSPKPEKPNASARQLFRLALEEAELREAFGALPAQRREEEGNLSRLPYYVGAAILLLTVSGLYFLQNLSSKGKGKEGGQSAEADAEILQVKTLQGRGLTQSRVLGEPKNPLDAKTLKEARRFETDGDSRGVLHWENRDSHFELGPSSSFVLNVKNGRPSLVFEKGLLFASVNLPVKDNALEISSTPKDSVNLHSGKFAMKREGDKTLLSLQSGSLRLPGSGKILNSGSTLAIADAGGIKELPGKNLHEEWRRAGARRLLSLFSDRFYHDSRQEYDFQSGCMFLRADQLQEFLLSDIPPKTSCGNGALRLQSEFDPQLWMFKDIDGVQDDLILEWELCLNNLYREDGGFQLQIQEGQSARNICLRFGAEYLEVKHEGQWQTLPNPKPVKGKSMHIQFAFGPNGKAVLSVDQQEIPLHDIDGTYFNVGKKIQTGFCAEGSDITLKSFQVWTNIKETK